jgi:16S rRNA (guanine527-N7)-methyltransferase
MTPEARLAGGLAALGLMLPAGTRRRLIEYLALLAKWNRVYKLTAVDDPERIISHHLLDSIAVLAELERVVPGLGRLADVGSGAGLPGLPLAMVRPAWHVALVESSHKKTSFLRQAVVELGITNVEVVAQRAENWHPPHAFDVVISRAVSDLADFARVAGHLCAVGGRLAAMKGLHPHDEIAQLSAAWTAERVARLTVPGLAAERHLVIMRMA